MQRVRIDDTLHFGVFGRAVPDFKPIGFLRYFYIAIQLRHFKFIIFQLMQKYKKKP